MFVRVKQSPNSPRSAVQIVRSKRRGRPCAPDHRAPRRRRRRRGPAGVPEAAGPAPDRGVGDRRQLRRLRARGAAAPAARGPGGRGAATGPQGRPAGGPARPAGGGAGGARRARGLRPAVRLPRASATCCRRRATAPRAGFCARSPWPGWRSRRASGPACGT